MKLSLLLAFAIQWTFATSRDDPKSNQITNNVNPDGSFQFGYQNNDRGGHYHQSSGNPITKVRGRYGSRNPGSGRVDETVYTAGPRGFRARGANIHRKQNLSQVPRSPVGSPTDPLADPYDDPSYAFGFKTKSHSRREESDSNGRVHGEFIYVDDVGEKHGVKYKAGANVGFEVENGVPDSPLNIRYNTPLYKSEPTARGRITFERGPDRQYKFLTSSPDQRRAEATGPDGITRGSYSYLDDKGVQRTVQYIAGAGIGYKVIQSTVGPGTHVSANADVPEYTVKAVSNEIAVTDEENTYHTGPSAPDGPGYVSSTVPPYSSSYPPSTPSYPPSLSPFSSSTPSYPPPTPSYPPPTPSYPPSSPYPPPAPYPPPTPYPPSPYPPPTPYPPSAFSTVSQAPRPFSRPFQHQVFVSTPSSIGGIDRNHPAPTVPAFPSGGPSPLAPSGPTGSGENDIIYGLLPPKDDNLQFGPPAGTPSGPPQIHITPSPTTFHPSPAPTFHPGSPQTFHPSVASTFHPSPTPTFHPGPTYLPTADANSPPFPPSAPVVNYHHHQIIPQRYPVDAVIKNTSNGWFYGIPPGSAVRAHIQNIDLVPTHDRALSPSDALRLDEERDAHHHRNSHPRV